LIFACDRYNLSDSLIDRFLLFAILIIPSVFLFIYNHGKPGKDSWTKIEKTVLPSNFLIALLAAAFIGGSSGETKAVPTAVEITNEEGEQFTRMIPSASQTRQIAIFPLEMDEGENTWARFAFPILLSKDLEQDMRIFTRLPRSMQYYYNSFDYKIGDKIPFSTKLQIANKTKVDYFIEGTLKKNTDEWVAKLKIFETGSGELFQENSYNNVNLFELVDQYTKELSTGLFLKENESEFNKFVDLPASDLITSNEEALSTYIAGIRAYHHNDAFEEALPTFIKATQLDEKSAELKLAASNAYTAAGDQQNGIKMISAALGLCKQLPERQQLGIKQTYYAVNQQVDKMFLLMENWIKLYPQDYEPHKDIITFYKMTYQLSKAKEMGLLAIANGHRNRVLGEMADLSIQLEDLDEAEKYITEYHEVYPELAKDDTRLADVYNKRGEFDKAKTFLEKRLIEDPQKSSLYREIAQVETASGDLDLAETNYMKAIKFANQSPDSANLYRHLLHFYSSYGEREKFVAVSEKWQACMRTHMPEIGVAYNLLQTAELFQKIGKADIYKTYFENFGTTQPQMKSTFDCYHKFLLSLHGDDPLELQKYNQGECKKMVMQGTPNLENMVNGYLASMEGKHQEAIDNINIFIENSGSGGKEFGYLLAKEYRLLGKPDKAIEACRDFLKTSPNHPDFLFQLAMAQKAKMDIKGGQKTYNNLKKLWKNIDSQFRYYSEFQELSKLYSE